MNGRHWLAAYLYPLSAASYFDDKCSCDCVSYSMNCIHVYICYKLALSSVAYVHFEYDALIGSTTINSYCMDRNGSRHQAHLSPWQRPQQQRSPNCDDDWNQLIDLAWTSMLVLLLQSSDDLTTHQTRDDVISRIKYVSHTITTLF